MHSHINQIQNGVLDRKYQYRLLSLVIMNDGAKFYI